jgi:hypothetical protein
MGVKPISKFLRIESDGAQNTAVGYLALLRQPVDMLYRPTRNFRDDLGRNELPQTCWHLNYFRFLIRLRNAVLLFRIA